MDPFSALASPIRRELLQRMAAGPIRVADLAAEHQASRPAISRHLRVLGEAGLTRAEDRGRERHYRLDRKGLEPLAELLAKLDAKPAFAESALDALDLEVRRTARDRRTARRFEESATTNEEMR